MELHHPTQELIAQVIFSRFLILAALDHFKQKDGVLDKNAPTEFLTAAEQVAVFEGKFRVSLYKAFLFLHVMGAVKSGTLNLKHSYKYRSLDDYLISREHAGRKNGICSWKRGLDRVRGATDRPRRSRRAALRAVSGD